jgi:hypothetical protein
MQQLTARASAVAELRDRCYFEMALQWPARERDVVTDHGPSVTIWQSRG